MLNKNATTLAYSHTFQQMPNILNDSSELSQNDKAVGAAIFNRNRQFGRCSYSNGQIARRLFISIRTVARAINKLESLGFIVRKGLSFTRKIALGIRFAISNATYAKPNKKEKNLPTSAKPGVALGRHGIQNNNLIKRNNSDLTILERQQYKWYKENSHVPISKEWQYLFE